MSGQRRREHDQGRQSRSQQRPAQQHPGYAAGGYPSGNPFEYTRGQQNPFGTQTQPNPFATHAHPNPFDTPAYPNPAAASSAPSVPGFQAQNGLWYPNDNKFFTRHPKGPSYERRQYLEGRIPFPQRPQRPRPSEDSDDEEEEESTSSEEESSESDSSKNDDGRRRKWSVSTGTLIQAMQIQPRWTKNCFQRALHFAETRPNREAGRINTAADTARFKSWVHGIIAQTLLLREPNSEEPEEIEAGEFSPLSFYAADLVQRMTESRSTYLLTYFCGSYRDVHGTPDGVPGHLLRSLCHQLLNLRDARSNATDLCICKEVLKAIQKRQPAQLMQLFEKLVAVTSKSYGAILCLIDGLHVVEESENGHEIFQRLFHAFEHVSDRSRRDQYNFKVLLTLPQQSSKNWERLDNGGIVVVSLPPKNARA